MAHGFEDGGLVFFTRETPHHQQPVNLLTLWLRFLGSLLSLDFPPAWLTVLSFCARHWFCDSSWFRRRQAHPVGNGH